MRLRPIPACLCVLGIALSQMGTVFGDDEAEPTAKERVLSQNNLRQIGLACLNYESTYKSLPNNIVDKDGKPLLSWRVTILPQLEQEALYNQFKLDEPWDSENNKKLVEKMPKLYAPVRGKAEKNTTFYTMFSGEGAVLNPKKKIRIIDIKDGASNTFLVVESGEPVIWSKPEDLSFEAEKELPKLGGLFKGDFNALFCDGSSRFMNKTTDPKTLKALITIRGREVIDLDK